jgi:hypothetical protein
MRLHRQANSVGRNGDLLFSSSIRFLGIISVLLGVASGQNGDELLVDLCGCSPGTYEFTFDFSLTCPPINVTRSGGVAATFCQISSFGDPDDNITDLVPVCTSSFVFSLAIASSSREHSNPSCPSLF